MKSIKANLVDIVNHKIYPVSLTVSGNKIEEITEISNEETLPYLMPGFVDAHIHIESSMLIPSEFARMAVPHGTIGTVSDPHEIANVLGVDGVLYMIENGKRVPFHYNFGAPSCVPATNFETAGAKIDSDEIKILLEKEEVGYLAEMMNWPGVLFEDAEVLRKIEIAKELGKPVDGHAPGLSGEDAIKYINAGISTDHECFTEAEAAHKLKHGMKVIIREGSAARNFEALHPLIDEHYSELMFCSDDKHPDELEIGHINLLVKRAVEKGHDVFKVLQMACINPVKHYGLKVGLLQQGDAADFILVEDLKDFKVLQTYIDGELVAENGKSFIPSVSEKAVNYFNINPIQPESLQLAATAEKIKVIVPKDGELVTGKELIKAKVENGKYVSDLENDILKIVVVNRYNEAKPAIAFIKNFGLKEGAIASSVAHDSHNIVAVGVSDEAITKAINLVIDCKGGVSACNGEADNVLPLPVAGLMSLEEGHTVAKKYAEIDAFAKKLGSTLRAPFMSLSFMALLVIPSLKLSDKGLFDGDKFSFTSVDA
ncbi:adenine deaminase [Chondrinema litorale]|uniref:adenine deaminase n=1 Tax=Chondrinema litorale TaxID=2994555 RepID=UPI0025445737|nr:adenine deaminase [Chondrinema litorale]UZR94844.1 adenine deaminase [Chondrinema litorale]